MELNQLFVSGSLDVRKCLYKLYGFVELFTVLYENKLIFATNVNIGEKIFAKCKFEWISCHLLDLPNNKWVISTQSRKSRGIIFIFCRCSQSEFLYTKTYTRCVSNSWFLYYSLQINIESIEQRTVASWPLCNLCFHFTLCVVLFHWFSIRVCPSHSLRVPSSKLQWSLPQCHRNIICLCLAIHLLGLISFRSNLGSLASCATQFHGFH